MKKNLSLATALAAALALAAAGVGPAVAADGTTGVSGTVKLGSAPVANTYVDFKGIGASDGQTAYGQTDATGTYAATYVTPGTYVAQVYAYNANYLTTYSGNTVREPDAKPITVTSGATAAANISVVASAVVTGKVVDAKGRAVKGVSVAGTNLSRAGYANAQTDATGHYVLRGLATGTVQVTTYRTAGGANLTASVKVAAKQGSVKAAKTLKLKAAGSAKITGKIKTSGSAVANQGVSLLSSKKVTLANARPSKSGKVTFAGLKAGTYTVVVDGTNITKKVTVKAGKTKSFGTIARAKLTTIKGVVKSSAKKPVAAAYVYVVDAYGTIAGQAQTNTKGRYAVKGLVSGKYTVYVTPTDGSRDYAAAVKITASKGKNVARNINLSKGSTVSGVVKHGAAGVEGVTVWVGAAQATTDAHGKYTITGVAPGKTAVYVSDPYTGGYRDAVKKIVVKKGKALRVATIAVK
ncbi:carboxypeptidase-like regulatory domain-containing protein [Cellulomonas rhizosphaerae]|uniref:carboxypeptidase-like regulatory domain-containing protein n=1 Tax=Cellulomonas rhizosphaerae TaxID=2293719 RepID=UPI0010FEADAB|nr:carboxypeptidase-like regulatory domain-containing protein [Cellulomonas rhizosphaerae]